MAKYAYKMNYNNEYFLQNLKNNIGEVVTSSECTSDCMVIIETDPTAKDDLDECMNARGFTYLFKPTKDVASARDWGVMLSTNLPTSDLSLGDHVYCSDTKKPLWWDGSKWLDASGV